MSTKRLTQEIFIERAKLIHGDKYNYSLSKYINSRTKINISCPIHGIFMQKADSHLSGIGCSKCSKKHCLDKNEFINEANEIHGEKYDYSNVFYKNGHTNIIIICPNHGNFTQQPRNHLKGHGCIICSGKNKKTLNEFIQKSNIIHENKYDYSLSIYEKGKNKLKIICPVHGKFIQTPDKHLQGRGCPICSESKGEKTISKILSGLGVKYLREKKFDDCKGKVYMLPFDFYLPEYNICIEYDGKQHFEPISFFGGNEGFKTQKKSDKIKDDYCKNNSINILRISYKDNIEQILKNQLFTITL